MSPNVFDLYSIDLPHFLQVLSLASVRTLVCMAMLPIFAAKTIPAMVRTGLCMVVVIPVATGQLSEPLPVELNAVSMLCFLAKEAAVGLIIGLGFGAFLAGLQTAGEIMDHQTGLTFTQNIDAVHGNNVSLTAQFLERVLFASLMAAGALLVIIDTLYLSYQVWPLGRWMPTFERVVLFELVTQASKLFALSLLLAGPALLALLVVDTGMGLLNRAAPQLNVNNLTSSLKSVVSLGVLMLALPMITERVMAALHEVAGTLSSFLTLLK
jgi:type III secretion protein T